jgi:hypothetical protein
MLENGLYDLSYRPDADASASPETALVVLRDGTVLGSDQWGGVFEGRCILDVQSGRHMLDVMFRLPPGGVLVTAAEPSVEGELIHVDAELGEAENRYTFVASIAGQPVRFFLDYRGRLPT